MVLLENNVGEKTHKASFWLVALSHFQRSPVSGRVSPWSLKESIHLSLGARLTCWYRGWVQVILRRTYGDAGALVVHRQNHALEPRMIPLTNCLYHAIMLSRLSCPRTKAARIVLGLMIPVLPCFSRTLACYPRRLVPAAAVAAVLHQPPMPAPVFYHVYDVFGDAEYE